MGVTSTSSINRSSFSKIDTTLSIPDLLDIQLASFEEFLQEDVLPEKRENKGLEAVFRNMFPVEDTRRNYVLEYKHYFLGLPKYTVKECLERRISYTLPLKVRFVLHITDEDDRSKYVQNIEQDVFFGNIPFMTESGTFIINGAERVIVSQLQRSPGVFFDQNFHPNGTKIFQARIIPFRGSWVDFTTDIYDCIYAIIDRRRKFPATLLLRALGFSTDRDIFEAFGMTKAVKISNTKKLVGKNILEDVVDKNSGEVIAEQGVNISDKLLETLKAAGVKELHVIADPNQMEVEMLTNTLGKDPTKNSDEALQLLYQHLRTGEAPTVDIARKFIEKMFFSTKKYDLGAVGRYRINKKFDLHAPVEEPILIRDDFIHVFKHLFNEFFVGIFKDSKILEISDFLFVEVIIVFIDNFIVGFFRKYSQMSFSLTSN